MPSTRPRGRCVGSRIARQADAGIVGRRPGSRRRGSGSSSSSPGDAAVEHSDDVRAAASGHSPVRTRGQVSRRPRRAARCRPSQRWTATTSAAGLSPTRVILRRVSDTYCSISLMADFLEEKRREIESRLNELKPLVEEHRRLESALAALAGVDAPRPRASKRRTPARRSSSTGGKSTSAEGTGRRGRPKGSGTRGKQALELIGSAPRDHDPGARRGDGDPAELPLPRACPTSRRRARSARRAGAGT